MYYKQNSKQIQQKLFVLSSFDLFIIYKCDNEFLGHHCRYNSSVFEPLLHHIHEFHPIHSENNRHVQR